MYTFGMAQNFQRFCPTSVRLQLQASKFKPTILHKSARMTAAGTHPTSVLADASAQSLEKPLGSGSGGSPQAMQERRRPTQGQLAQAAAFPSPVPLVDIGCNLVDPSFRSDLPAVLQRARDANVRALVVTGTCVRTSTAAAHLCESQQRQEGQGQGRGQGSYPLFFTAGVHPHNAKQCDRSTLEELRRLAAHPRCVAIGECGLDFNRNFSPPDVQERWFEEQVLLAKELRRPLFMHCRDAGERFAEILRRHSPLPAPAVVHCFTGSGRELETFLELGLYIGITGWICDDRPERGGAELASLLDSIPRERLMIETDAPYLVPRSIKPSRARPGRNEPSLLPHVLQAAAAAMGVTPEELGRSTTAVACRVFGLPADALGLQPDNPQPGGGK
ncbi:hypothetical protein PLESTB_000497900 [Pleodorina starrii]|uniref:Uncharacterized protein n=1 Tax=Pleodorina starrii TaxID=330485 RepID=A0A9W6BGK9_9CHLO|nr:hypothetical protein PLESTM_000369300 [Pleodorina starrii]GLC51398.1 hypothetical protein PLESTB_000497900 [Pleodorina starrii]GLC63764.1 hypothetical protein PLESTF_000071500 [Pleodorina starrii]